MTRKWIVSIDLNTIQACKFGEFVALDRNYRQEKYGLGSLRAGNITANNT